LFIGIVRLTGGAVLFAVITIGCGIDGSQEIDQPSPLVYKSRHLHWTSICTAVAAVPTRPAAVEIDAVEQAQINDVGNSGGQRNARRSAKFWLLAGDVSLNGGVESNENVRSASAAGE
jgi:hypothetical protein